MIEKAWLEELITLFEQGHVKIQANPYLHKGYTDEVTEKMHQALVFVYRQLYGNVQSED